MTIKQMAPADRVGWAYISRKAGFFQIALTVLVAIMLSLSSADSLASQYFFDHDAYLLLAGSLVLIGIGAMPLHGKAVPACDRRWLFAICTAAGAIAYAATFVIFHRYAVSRDEQLAQFGASYFSTGAIGWPIPPHLRDLGRAMMPLYAAIRPGHWTSDYLPINSAIRALFARAGDQWLAGPVLLMGGLLALSSSARQIWPQNRRAMMVAVIMAATSTQVLINAATPFAMTGHFALNSLWLAFFLRGGRSGHGGAIATGLLASGLHQAHFHIVFVLCFAIWLLIDRRYRLAAMYVGACLFYWFVWRFAYPAMLDMALGQPLLWQSGILPHYLSAVAKRLAQMEPGESITRFIAWQNLLLLPLAIMGAASARHARGEERILIGCAIAGLAGMMTMVLQDHGYGYRYLHPLIPSFCLLAAGGWVALERRIERPLPGMILLVSVIFAAVVTFPVATWRIMVSSAPYEAAYRAARMANTDYLFVDARAGAYLQDIVGVEEDRSSPVLLDLGYVPAAAVARLCARSRTMLFGEEQARAFGIPVDRYLVTNHAETAARATQLERLGCVHPMPVRQP